MPLSSPPSGLWLPLITPFKDGALDEASFGNLVNHYVKRKLGGLVLAATTGEGMTLNDREIEKLVGITAETIGANGVEMPVFVGLAGCDPRALLEQLKRMEVWPVDGYLINSPHYLRPSQNGLKQYFEGLAGETDRDIIVYNIPYRTGVNLLNETLLALAERPNIVGVKDCCGDPEQSYALMRTAPSDFSVLTGEDPFFYNGMVHGAPGAIVTGAHVLLDFHLDIADRLGRGDWRSALTLWQAICHVPKVLFCEPNPAPLKYWLWREGWIESPQVRAPFHCIGAPSAAAIDGALEGLNHIRADMLG